MDQTFAIDTWTVVLYSLGHGRKHMVAIYLTLFGNLIGKFPKSGWGE